MFSNKLRVFTANRVNNLNAFNKQISQNTVCNNLLNKIISCGFKDMRKMRKGKRFN